MARKSRKNEAITSPGPNDYSNTGSLSKLYHAGLYARLSLESEANRDRCTIETQMQLLHGFVDGEDDIVVEKEYLDVSETGTDFKREGFEEMVQDMRSGLIDCIIVKDLSRLGRNYIETGNYVERVFPFFGIRFIAVTDGFDSSKDEVNLMVCLSNIFNEYYSRDLGKKIKSAYRSAWKNGESFSGSVCYGLMKDGNDKHKLVPDPATAPVIQKIFDMFNDGKEYAEIRRYLEKERIPSPTEYEKIKKGQMKSEEAKCKWGYTTVRRLLSNRYLAGDSVHNQFTHDSFAEKKQVPNPESEWIIVENTHEAVVSKDVFNRAQKELKRRLEKQIKKPGMYRAAYCNLFKGKIRCSDCGSAMYLHTQNAGASLRYCCGGNSNKKICPSSHIVDANKVYDETFRVIHAHMNVYTDTVDMVRRLNSRQEVIERYDVISREIKKIRRNLSEFKERRTRLYEDYSLKLIDAEQYVRLKDSYSEQEISLKKKLDELLIRQAQNDRNYHTDEEWMRIVEKYRNVRKLTKPMVDAFVEAILVEEDGNLNIELKYDDMLIDLVKLAKEKEAGNDSE